MILQKCPTLSLKTRVKRYRDVEVLYGSIKVMRESYGDFGQSKENRTYKNCASRAINYTLITHTYTSSIV